jgi:hypothetical protein
MYVQYVGISTPPCDYQQRLVAVYSQAQWKNLRVFGLEAHDLALSKIERNNRRDSQDVRGLAQAGLIDPDILEARYHQEVRPLLPAQQIRVARRHAQAVAGGNSGNQGRSAICRQCRRRHLNQK